MCALAHGGIFSTGKRRAPLEAESAASHPRPFNDPDEAHQSVPAAAQPPLKRRRIEPHNDPITPYYVPPSVTTKEADRNDRSHHDVNISSRPTNTEINGGPVRRSAPGTSTFRAGTSSNHQELTSNNSAIEKKSQIQVPKTPRRVKKRRFAIFLGFNGSKYFGMQLNVGVDTIEGELLKSFRKAGLVSDSFELHPSKIGFMRAARTDKGVSAAAQLVSAFFELPEDQSSNLPAVAQLLNEYLPDDITVYGLLRVTPSFSARHDCHKRRYEYIFPLHLLGGSGNVVMTDGESGQDRRVQKFSAILKQYEGAHNFVNFTDGVKPNEDTARRFMMRVACLPPFRPPGSAVYYVTVEIIGQSFLLYQIRRMVGLALIIYHGHAPPQSIPVALCGHVRFVAPTAPPDGLLLDTLYFEQYNRRLGHSIPKNVSDEYFSDLKREFKADQIYRQIARKEQERGVMEEWVRNCESKIHFSSSEILAMHEKFVLTDAGKRQIRDEYVASLYAVKPSMEEFLDCDSQDPFRRLADRVRSSFKYRYGSAPAFMVRAPGRVILIGEHLDYNGLPVMTAALRHGTVIAGSFDDGMHVDVAHLEDSVYRPGRMDANGKLEGEHDQNHNSRDEITIDDEGEDEDKRDARWLRYVGCGVKALGKYLRFKRTVSGGGRLLIGGDLPRAGGLASSSSLVCSSMLAAARLSRRRLPREDLAIAAAEGERGGAKTAGGSVDHVTSMCSTKGHVIHASFVPRLEVEHLKWPREAKLFAVNSGVVAEKGGDESVRLKFNLRAAECRVGSAIAALRLNVVLANAVATPGQLMFNVRKTPSLKCDSIEQLASLVQSVIDRDERISVQEAQEILQLADSKMKGRFLTGVDTANVPSLNIGKRLAHVYEEACRVRKFKKILSDEKMDVSQKIESMGQILNEGHNSLQHLFESSVEQVDELVRVCREAGAVGSRMTGAGWGGFIVNIVHEPNARSFEEALVEKVGRENVLEIEPWSGASVLTILANANADKKKSENVKSEEE